MLSLDHFGRREATLAEELLSLAREVADGLPLFYWLGAYRTQLQRFRRAYRALGRDQREWQGGDHPWLETALAARLALRAGADHLRSAYRAARRGCMAEFQLFLQQFQASLEQLDQLSDQLDQTRQSNLCSSCQHWNQGQWATCEQCGAPIQVTDDALDLQG